MAFSQKLFSSLHNYDNPDTRIGELNRIWYDSVNNVFRIQLDTVTPGGTIIGGGSGGGSGYSLPTTTANRLGGVKIGSNISVANDGTISVTPGTGTGLLVGQSSPTINSPTINDAVFQNTFSIGTQVFYTHPNGFSVNENFDITNLGEQANFTGYHFTSGAGKTGVAFTLARTGNFTDGFGITGDAYNNNFVIGSETANTDYVFKTGIGMPFDVSGGTIIFTINRTGMLTLANGSTLQDIPDDENPQGVFLIVNENSTQFDTGGRTHIPNDLVIKYGGITFVDNSYQTTAWTGYPDQSSNGSKYLSTDGYSVSWQDAKTNQIFQVDPFTSGAGDHFRAGVLADLTNGVTVSTIVGTSGFSTTKTWNFDFAGNLTFPDTTVQTTAYTDTRAKGLFSVTTNSASGGGSLSYSSGVFTFTPAVTYSLPTASTSTLGGVKLDGSTITIDSSGVISSNWPPNNTTGSSGPTVVTIGKNTSAGVFGVSIGAGAGAGNQSGSSTSSSSINIGYNAGNAGQLDHTIAIGSGAGNSSQGRIAIAIGYQAGATSQGNYAIAIGANAGYSNQPANTIILNATSSNLNGVSSQTSSFYVAPVRTDNSPSNVLFYNTTTNEVTYGTLAAAAGTLTGTTLNSTVVSSSLTSVGTLTSLSSGAITTTGTLALNASGGITTNQTTFPLVNTTATTVNFAGAATTISMGASGVTLNVGSGQSGFIFQKLPGGTGAAMFNANITPSTTNYNILTDGGSLTFNTATGGSVYTAVNNSIVTTTSSTGFTVAGTTTIATTLATSAASTATVNLINTGLSGGTLNIGGSTGTINLGGNSSVVTIGGTSQTTISASTIATGVSSGTLNLFNSGLTGTLNFGGVATTINIGTNSTTTSIGSTTVNMTSATAVNIGASTGTTAIKNSATIAGNLGITYTPATTTGTAILTTGKDTQGGTGYFDFLRATNTTSGVSNGTKTMRLDSSGNLQILNNAYTSVIFQVSDAGQQSLGQAASTNNDATTNFISFNNQKTVIYDDGNTHIHNRSANQSIWINTNGGDLRLLQQPSVSGGNAGNSVMVGGDQSSTATAFLNVLGSKSYSITGYGYLSTGGAGHIDGNSGTVGYGIYCSNRIQSGEVDVASDERVKNIQGTIPLDKALQFVRTVNGILYTWRPGFGDEGLKSGFSAQSVHKAGFDHMIGHIPNDRVEGTVDDDGWTHPDKFQLTMGYNQAIPYHHEVIKHLLDRIEQLEEMVGKLTNGNNQ
jgi:hypothetical protein